MLKATNIDKEFTDTLVGWKSSDVNTVHRKWSESDTVTARIHTHTRVGEEKSDI